jgi:hypothetical protein
MKLNIYNNFRAIYYNTLANFYLCFNSFVPYYDDVIISLSITSFKNIINNNLNLKSIKQNRMIQLLYSLNDKDKLIVDDDGYIIIYYDKDDKICAADAEERVATEEDDEADADEERAATEEDADVSPSNPDVSPSNPDVSPSNPDISPSNPDVSPSNPDVSPSNPDVSPSNPDVSPSNPDVSPSNPDEAANAAFETEEVNEHYNSSDKKNN